jgi:hypothetical protein
MLSESLSRRERRPLAPPGEAFQYNLFTNEADPLEVDVEPGPAPAGHLDERLDEGIGVVKSEEGSHVVVTGFGCWFGKKSERLVVRRGDGKVPYQFPFLRLQEVIVASRGISVSTELVSDLCERGALGGNPPGALQLSSR